MKIILDNKHKDMYRIEWPNGDISVNSEQPSAVEGVYGFYNKTRAKELIRRGGIENYEVGKIYNAPMARLEAH